MAREVKVQPEAPTMADIAEQEAAQRAAEKREAFRRNEGILSKHPSEQQMFPEDANLNAPVAETKADYKKPGGARMANYPNIIRQDM